MIYKVKLALTNCKNRVYILIHAGQANSFTVSNRKKNYDTSSSLNRFINSKKIKSLFFCDSN